MFPRILHLSHAIKLQSILREVTAKLRFNISQTLYIGPARARSERYYRYQDLAVSEIDANGTNFPMFLNSLPKSQLENLSDWVEGLFNYRIALEPSGGHISINLIEGKSVTNIVDTGYGVSQILPVLGQIWWSTSYDTRRARASSGGRASMLAIEQPELHLHPAHQAMLADALVSKLGRSASSRGVAPHFLVETHSEALVNRLGELIALGKVKSEDVQVLVFSAAEEERSTSVQISHFDDDGVLKNWPYGFFLPEAC